METKLLLYILLAPALLFSQAWETAEWVLSNNERDTGWVQIPALKWRESSFIRLKTGEKNKDFFRGRNVIFLRLLEKEQDTLIVSPFVDGKHRKLQLLIKGDTALFKEIKRYSYHYYIYRNGSYKKWNRYNITEDLTDIFRIYDGNLRQRLLSNKEKQIINLIERLNKEQPNPSLSIHSWRYSLGYSYSFKFYSDDQNYHGYDKKQGHYFSLGVEKNLTATGAFSANTKLSYSWSERSGIFRANTPNRRLKYNTQLKTAFIKISAGLQFELFPKRNISPLLSAGYVLAIPTLFKRTLDVAEMDVSLNGMLSNQELKIKMPSEIGKLIAFGIRYNLTPKTRLNIIFQFEIFDEIIKFTDLNIDAPLFDLKRIYKKTPDVFLVGISYTHAL